MSAWGGAAEEADDSETFCLFSRVPRNRRHFCIQSCSVLLWLDRLESFDSSCKPQWFICLFFKTLQSPFVSLSKVSPISCVQYFNAVQTFRSSSLNFILFHLKWMKHRRNDGNDFVLAVGTKSLSLALVMWPSEKCTSSRCIVRLFSSSRDAAKSFCSLFVFILPRRMFRSDWPSSIFKICKIVDLSFFSFIYRDIFVKTQPLKIIIYENSKEIFHT